MQQRVEISSFQVSKIKDRYDSFTKYDIEASIDEVESEDDHIKLKYKFVLLSNPTNVKISVDGFTTVYGNQQEMTRQLSNDERNIPRAVSTLYQEIFPFLYITSKTMEIPCPAYKLSDISKARQIEETQPVQVEEKIELEPMEHVTPSDELTEIQSQPSIEPAQSLIQEQNISSTV